jgi:hypothetical protein
MESGMKNHQFQVSSPSAGNLIFICCPTNWMKCQKQTLLPVLGKQRTFGIGQLSTILNWQKPGSISVTEDTAGFC